MMHKKSWRNYFKLLKLKAIYTSQKLDTLLTIELWNLIAHYLLFLFFPFARNKYLLITLCLAIVELYKYNGKIFAKSSKFPFRHVWTVRPLYSSIQSNKTLYFTFANGDTKLHKQICPASANNFATSPTLLIFSSLSSIENPRFLLSPVRMLSPSRPYAGMPLDTRKASSSKDTEVFPAPDSPVNQTVHPRKPRSLPRIWPRLSRDTWWFSSLTLVATWWLLCEQMSSYSESCVDSIMLLSSTCKIINNGNVYLVIGANLRCLR